MNFKSRPPLHGKSRSMTPMPKGLCGSVKRQSDSSVTRCSDTEMENSSPTTDRVLLLPKLTSRCWVVYDMAQNKPIVGSQMYSQRQVASLTKIMTFITSVKICEGYGVSLQTELFVSKCAASQNGTSAHLRYGTTVSIEDLFYGLMLPSGNDAAVVLAEGLGQIIRREEAGKRPCSSSATICFVNAMQQLSHQFKLTSRWANPHGLSNSYNKSCAYDIAKLAQIGMQIPIFKKVVNTKQYKQWTNTNKLLDEGWSGVKTGVTNVAGPCLAASYKDYIIVLLGCKSMEQRWIECRKLKQWLGQ